MLRATTIVLVILGSTGCKTSGNGLGSGWTSFTQMLQGPDNSQPKYAAIGHDRLVSETTTGKEADLKEQSAQLTQKLKKSPRDVDALLALARIKILLKDPHAAEILARRILTVDFRSRGAKIVMAHAAFLQKNTDGARAILRQLGGENATESESLNLLASILYQKGEERKAEGIFSRAVKLNPNDIAARMNLGIICLRSERLTQAEEQFSQVLKLKPDHADALAHMGVVQAQRGHTAQAIEFYKNAKSESPDSEIAGYNLALAQKRAGDFESAVDTLEDMLKTKSLSLAGHDAAMAQLELIRNAASATATMTGAEVDKIIAEAKQQRSKRSTSSTGDVYMTSNVGSYR